MNHLAVVFFQHLAPVSCMRLHAHRVDGPVIYGQQCYRRPDCAGALLVLLRRAAFGSSSDSCV
jgi:hypothetical protein